MYIKLNTEYEIRTDVDVFKKAYGECEFWVTDKQCQEAVVDWLAEIYIRKNPNKTLEEVKQIIDFTLDYGEFEITKDYEEVITEYFKDKTDELEMF